MKGNSAITFVTLFILIHTWNCSAWKEMKRAFNQALYQSFILGVTWPLTHKKKLLGALIRIFTKTLLSKEILNRYCKVLQRVTTILFISNTGNCMSLISTSLFWIVQFSLTFWSFQNYLFRYSVTRTPCLTILLTFKIVEVRSISPV